MLGVFAAMFIAMPAPVVSKIFPAIRTPIVAPALMAEPFIVINIVESGSDEKKWPSSQPPADEDPSSREARRTRRPRSPASGSKEETRLRCQFPGSSCPGVTVQM